jgi:hypothetical protein
MCFQQTRDILDALELCRLDGSVDKFEEFLKCLRTRLAMLQDKRKLSLTAELDASRQSDIDNLHDWLLFTFKPAVAAIAAVGDSAAPATRRALDYDISSDTAVTDAAPAAGAGVLVKSQQDTDGLSGNNYGVEYGVERSR